MTDLCFLGPLCVPALIDTENALRSCERLKALKLKNDSSSFLGEQVRSGLAYLVRSPLKSDES